jgi:hypothetical protein
MRKLRKTGNLRVVQNDFGHRAPVRHCTSNERDARSHQGLPVLKLKARIACDGYDDRHGANQRSGSGNAWPFSPLPFGCYCRCEFAACEWPGGIIVPPGRTCHRHAARLAYPVSQCLEKRKSVFWPIASFRKVSQSNRLILG